MSIFYQGPRAMAEWAKEEMAGAVCDHVTQLIEGGEADENFGLDEEHELIRQRDRVLKFLGFMLVKGKPVKL